MTDEPKMKKWKIAGSYGYVGTGWEEEIEAETEEDAYEVARETALQRVDYWVESIEDE